MTTTAPPPIDHPFGPFAPSPENPVLDDALLGRPHSAHARA